MIDTKAIDFRKKPFILTTSEGEFEVEFPLIRESIKQVKPLFLRLYSKWIVCALETLGVVADDESWALMTDIAKLFVLHPPGSTKTKPLSLDMLLLSEVEGLFLTQNRSSAIAEKDNPADYEIQFYEIDGLVSMGKEFKIDFFIPGALLELAGIDGRNLFLQAHTKYLRNFQAGLQAEDQQEGEEVTQPDTEPVERMKEAAPIESDRAQDLIAA